jgi:hypothetical protein
MEQNQSKTNRRRDLASMVAKIHGVTPDYVRKVIRTDRHNDDILDTVWAILDGENQLLEAVKKAVPFNPRNSIKRHGANN